PGRPLPPPINFLANPARIKTQSLPVLQTPPPRITILANPAKSPSLSPIPENYLPSEDDRGIDVAPVPQPSSPPRITILTNPARTRTQSLPLPPTTSGRMRMERSPASTERSQNTQNASGAVLVLKRALNSISILKAPAQAQSRR